MIYICKRGAERIQNHWIGQTLIIGSDTITRHVELLTRSAFEIVLSGELLMFQFRLGYRMLNRRFVPTVAVLETRPPVVWIDI